MRNRSGFYNIRCHCKRRAGLTLVKSNSRFQWHFQGKHEADTVNPNTAGRAHTSCRWESNSWWVPGACQETAHGLVSAFPCLIATIQSDSLRLRRRVMRNVDAQGGRSWVLIFLGGGKTTWPVRVRAHGFIHWSCTGDTSPPLGLRALRLSLIESDSFMENRLPAAHSHSGEATVS